MCGVPGTFQPFFAISSLSLPSPPLSSPPLSTPLLPFPLLPSPLLPSPLLPSPLLPSPPLLSPSPPLLSLPSPPLSLPSPPLSLPSCSTICWWSSVSRPSWTAPGSTATMPVMAGKTSALTSTSWTTAVCLGRTTTGHTSCR